MRAPKQLTFWLGVAGVSLITPIIFNLAADRLPIPGLKTLNNYATRRNG
jgi:hypothetical protein